MNKVDVLIVGAGPVGLQMALSLLRENLTVAIIDKKNGPTKTSNAVGVNCRTMEIWQSLGILNDALDRGLKVHATSLYSEDNLLNQVNFDLIKSKYNFMLSLPQAGTENLLLEHLKSHGQNVLWNTELIDISQDESAIYAKCKTTDDIIEINAKWAVGCDGYHSSVRELTGMSRVCHDLPLHFMMVDAKVTGDINTESVNIIFHNDGMIFMIPMLNNIRVVAEVSNDLAYKHLKSCSPEVFREIIEKRYPTMKIGQVDWSSAFYIHECLADNYRNGRIFIAGDAAHTHSPMGGQGMNTGIQDTWNLAWKIAQVSRGEASDKLLDTYDLERRSIGHDVLERSGKLTTMATTNNVLLKHLRNFGIHHFADWDIVRSKLANGISQANICYTNSPLVNHEQISKSEILRYPELQNGWHILSLTDKIIESIPSFVKIKQTDYIPLNKQYALIRPDGYVAIYSDSITEIQSYFINNL